MGINFHWRVVKKNNYCWLKNNNIILIIIFFNLLVYLLMKRKTWYQIILDNFIFNAMWLLLFTQHEAASVDMFDHMIKENNLASSFEDYKLLEKDLIFIKELIAGEDLPDASSSQVS